MSAFTYIEQIKKAITMYEAQTLQFLCATFIFVILFLSLAQLENEYMNRKSIDSYKKLFDIDFSSELPTDVIISTFEDTKRRIKIRKSAAKIIESENTDTLYKIKKLQRYCKLGLKINITNSEATRIVVATLEINEDKHEYTN